MKLIEMIEQVKQHPDIHKAGMILCHNGIVRGTSRDGSPVRELTVRHERIRLDDIAAEMKNRPGIIEVLIELNEGTLHPGDDIMYVVVAGDFRENVIPVISEAINLIKASAVEKTER